MRVSPLLIILIIGPSIARAQDSAASLRIQFASAGSVFQTGETIPVDLLFTANGDGYQMTTQNYDRGGRLGIEEFHVSPPGRDPLHDHYSGIYGGFIGGGLSTEKAVSADPTIMRFDLNEWVAPDQPGHYSLYIISGRVSRRDGGKLENVPLRSNTLEFDVVEASPAWQAQTLGTAAATLRDAGSTAEEKRAAARTLRFLDTPDAVRELAHQLTIAGDDKRWDAMAGILGSRHRQEALAELEAQFAAPDAAITAEFLSALAETKSLLHDVPLPDYPEEDKSRQEAWRLRQSEQMKQFAHLQDDLYRQAAALAASKRGTARAETVRTVLLRPGPGSEGEKPAILQPGEVASTFAVLSPKQQSELLQFYWERVKSPAMAHALEALLDQPPSRDAQMLRGLAMERLFELDPRAGRTSILAEIRHPQGPDDSAMANALTLLADETLPQMDETLAARLERKTSLTVDARLIGRYATAAILPRVQAVYEKSAGQWACDIEDGLVVYFLRVARDYGIERVRAKGGRCMPESVKAVVAAGRWPAVEPAMIAYLNDPAVYVARDAAETLARYGGSKAQRALWQRLRAFHQRWAEREAELVIAPGTPREAHDAVSLEFGLVEAMGRAQAWVLDNDQVNELEGLALGGERRNVEQWHWHSPVEMNLTTAPGGQINAMINNQFLMTDVASLQAKLAQYPSGTVFHVSAFGPADQLAPVTRAIHEAASQYGLMVEE